MCSQKRGGGAAQPQQITIRFASLNWRQRSASEILRVTKCETAYESRLQLRVASPQAIYRANRLSFSSSFSFSCSSSAALLCAPRNLFGFRAILVWPRMEESSCRLAGAKDEMAARVELRLCLPFEPRHCHPLNQPPMAPCHGSL